MEEGPYERRILRVLDHIHEHPAGDLSLDALAGVAAMSRFHWHRVFRAMTGETCAQAVRRIRLHRAANWLVNTGWPIATVAERAGMPNVRSFSRAFRDSYGLTPAAFRARGEIGPLNPTRKQGTSTMHDVEIRDLPDLRIAAAPHAGPYHEIGRAFQRVSAILTTRNLWPEAGRMVGVYYDDPQSVEPAALRSAAGFEFAGPIPDGLEEVTIPAGRFAVLRFRGPYSGLPAAYDHLYGDWLARAQCEPRDSPAAEIYLNSPMDTAPDDLLTEICMPIR